MAIDFEALVDQAQEDAYKPVRHAETSQARKIQRLIGAKDSPLLYDVRAREDELYVVINTRTYEVFAPYVGMQEARDVARELNRNADSIK